MAALDYEAPAELFPAQERKYTRQSIGYRRFARAADAIRFAIEELPPQVFLGTILEVDGRDSSLVRESRLFTTPTRGSLAPVMTRTHIDPSKGPQA
jgi:hypothetical protein